MPTYQLLSLSESVKSEIKRPQCNSHLFTRKKKIKKKGDSNAEYLLLRGPLCQDIPILAVVYQDIFRELAVIRFRILNRLSYKQEWGKSVFAKQNSALGSLAP
jgi:hypothetical protein